MSKIESFDRNTCKLMRLELDKALEDVANKFGINIHTGNASFSDNIVTFKVELATVNTNGVACSKDGEAFKTYASMLGMKPEMLGQECTVRGETYILTGYKPKSYKYPFIMTKKSTQQSFKFPEDSVKRAFNIV